MNKLIVGAGLAGLIAACHFKNADIIEAGPRIESHKALLRFRSDVVSNLTGIPFRKVSVNKEIHYNGEQHNRCTIAMANLYAIKGTDSLRDRSIWNLDPVERYVAPSDFYDQLVERHDDRILWNTKFEGFSTAEKSAIPVINTSPLPVVMEICGLESIPFEFERKSIKVDRYELPHDWDVYQTIYFPERDLRVMRASITGNILIVESVTKLHGDIFCWREDENDELELILRCFGIGFIEIELPQPETVDQKYGKIVELPKAQRESILYELTRDHNVFSLGRFATWRNILLDDVVKDIIFLDRLIHASEYGRRRII